MLDTLQEKEENVDRAIQTVRGIFAMLTKTLDQIFRAGAYHHIIIRKATGLMILEDKSYTILSLPLTGDGGHENQFYDKLKAKTEDKEINNWLKFFLISTSLKLRSTSSQQKNFKRKNLLFGTSNSE